MQHKKRQTRRSKSRRSRRSRGGNKTIDSTHRASCKNISKYKINHNTSKGFNWPDTTLYPGGCETPPVKINVPAGTEFDRFGPPSGNFGSPLQGRTYSYSSRALPYLRFTNNSSKLCDNVYQNETIKTNGYHVYKVKQGAQIVDVEQCTAVPAFNKPGHGVQWKFPDSIAKMIQDNVIEEIDYDSLPEFN